MRRALVAFLLHALVLQQELRNARISIRQPNGKNRDQPYWRKT